MRRITPSIAREPWNKGKLVGQKRPLKQRDVWTIRAHLNLADRGRDLAMFNLALDSKLRACDLISLFVRDVAHGADVVSRATIVQRKTQRPVVFEIMPPTKRALAQWIADAKLLPTDHLFPGRRGPSTHLSARQYARIVDDWCGQIGLDVTAYGTHSMRRTKVSMIYERTKNIRAVQLLLGHRKLENTVRYLGVELQDALALSEETEI
jgi:integrase